MHTRRKINLKIVSTVLFESYHIITTYQAHVMRNTISCVKLGSSMCVSLPHLTEIEGEYNPVAGS